MSINKFTTLLDLSRQAKIITGETATFDGKIEAGIPFSGYPTGVDTGTTVSLGIVTSQDCIFSGNTGTTLFDVSNVFSPNYSSIFSGYTGTTWTNPLFSGGTSGLTLPITTLSADTQIVGPFWTLTQTGYTGEYIIGTQYTGYSITYSFNSVSSILPNITFSGVTTATLENFSAGTLDYKGPLDYLQSVEDATIDGRLYTNKITISNGASASTIGYVLTQTGSNGEGEWLPNSSADTNTYVTGGTLSGTDLILDWNNGGTASPIDLSSLSGGTFTGNTSASCISDIYVSKIHSCSPLEINPLDEGDIVVGSNNNFYFDITNNRFGIGKVPSLGTIDIETTYGNFLWRPTLYYNTLSISGGSINQQQFVSLNEKSAFSLIQMGSGFTLNPTIGNPDDSSLLSFDANNLNIITKSGGTGQKNIKFFVGSDLTSPSDIHIQGTGATRGFVGFGTETPSEKIDVVGDMVVKSGGGSVYSDLNSAGGTFVVSGLTNIPRFGALIPSYLTKPSTSASFGIRTWDDTSFSNYGKVGDAFLRAGNETNGLNIINDAGTGTEDYIRFYAGVAATSTSHIHIQGTGSTIGFVGFGTENPTSKVDIIGNINIRNGSTASIYSDFITGGGSFTVSGSTDLPRLAVAAAPYLSKPLAGGSVGMRCWDDVTFVGYGKVGDMHVYASNEANGLNIINSPGTNPGVNPTEDYIRFYAGLQADDGTAHIHIQGSGATIGYVGIGTETPDSLLTVNGKTKTTQFQMTSGATNGYVLTSDGSGNATWQLGGSGTFSGGTVTGLSIFTAGLSANTISASTIQLSSGASNGYVLTSDGSGNATWQVPSGGGSSVTTATTTTINFTGQTIYYNATSPATGNISENLTGASLGLVQKIYHNDTSEPTFPGGWVLMGDAIYFTSTLNIIYAEWAGGSRVEYWYVQEQ